MSPTSDRVIFSLPLFNLNALEFTGSTLSNEEVFHCILQRGLVLGGPGLISLRPLLATTIVVNPKG